MDCTFGFVRAIDEFIAHVSTQAVEGGAFDKEGTLAAAPTQAQDPAFAAALWQRLAERVPADEPRLVATA